MEVRHSIEETSNEAIINFSSALEKAQIDGYDSYYTDDNCPFEFFKIPVPYLKEQETDPDVHYIFVDVENSVAQGLEYTVYGNYAHEHCKTIDFAIFIIGGLIAKSIVEVSLVIGDASVSAFIGGKGSDEKNVEFFMGNFEQIKENLNNPVWEKGTNGHLHTQFTAEHPFSLIGNRQGAMKIPGTKTYAVSAEFGKHPEFYIMEKD